MNKIKIEFALERDDDGYPPADTETLWAKLRYDGHFELDSIPFFVREVSLGDVVEASGNGEVRRFRRVIEPSGHSTLHVIVFDATKMDGVRKALRELGCESELSHVAELVAVDVPPDISVDEVTRYLDEKEADNELEYQTGALRHP